jgi:hypothetical protein
MSAEGLLAKGTDNLAEPTRGLLDLGEKSGVA